MCLFSALFMIRDCTFLAAVNDKDKMAYVDEWPIIAPEKLKMLKKRIEDKFNKVCNICKMLVCRFYAD